MRTFRTVAPATILTTLFGVACTLPFAQGAQHFPVKPVRLVVAGGAGGQQDVVARLIADKLGKQWGQPVVVENRPGASGTLAASTVASSTPDGYTLLTVSPAYAINAALDSKLPFDPRKDLVAVTQIGFATGTLVVASSSGLKSVKELVAIAHDRPGKVLFGSSGARSFSRLNAERFRFAAGIDVTHVAFKGVSETLIEILGGRIHFCSCPLGSALPLIRDGKLRALAVTTPQRSPLLPDVPALAETLPEFKRPDFSFGLLAPAGTPPALLARVSKDVALVLGMADVRERLSGQGFVPEATTPEEYARLLSAQMTMLSKLLTIVGLRAP